MGNQWVLTGYSRGTTRRSRASCRTGEFGPPFARGRVTQHSGSVCVHSFAPHIARGTLEGYFVVVGCSKGLAYPPTAGGRKRPVRSAPHLHKRAVWRVRSADLRSDTGSDVIANVSRRCEPSKAHSIHLTAPSGTVDTRCCLGCSRTLSICGCNVLPWGTIRLRAAPRMVKGTSSSTEWEHLRVLAGTPRRWQRQSTAWTSPGAPTVPPRYWSVLASTSTVLVRLGTPDVPLGSLCAAAAKCPGACRAVVRRRVRVRCRGQQRVPGALRADRDGGGVPHRGRRRGQDRGSSWYF
jgi:hypothetical protein